MQKVPRSGKMNPKEFALSMQAERRAALGFGENHNGTHAASGSGEGFSGSGGMLLGSATARKNARVEAEGELATMRTGVMRCAARYSGLYLHDRPPQSQSQALSASASSSAAATSATAPAAAAAAAAAASDASPTHKLGQQKTVGSESEGECEEAIRYYPCTLADGTRKFLYGRKPGCSKGGNLPTSASNAGASAVTGSLNTGDLAPKGLLSKSMKELLADAHVLKVNARLRKDAVMAEKAATAAAAAAAVVAEAGSSSSSSSSSSKYVNGKSAAHRDSQDGKKVCLF
jgi:hypothetical protein